MLQRIQTLFLLASAVLLTCMFFHPFFSLGEVTFGYTDHLTTRILLILSVAIGYLNIFMYRKRAFQMRLCIFNCLILLGLQGVIAYYVFTMDAGVVFSLTAAFPAIAVILTFMALRYIARDEALLRAVDRLRK